MLFKQKCPSHRWAFLSLSLSLSLSRQAIQLKPEYDLKRSQRVGSCLYRLESCCLQ